MHAEPTYTAQRAIAVAIVEDDSSLADALCAVITDAPDMRLAGVARSCAEGLALLQGQPADVLLVDLGLPDGSGIDVIRAATRMWTACNVVVSTHFVDEAHVIRSIEAGATGYLLKDSSPARIADEIRSVARGGSPISPIIARQILARFRQSGANSPERGSTAEPAKEPGPTAVGARRSPSPDTALLSTREKEVLDLIVRGFTTQEIAKLMALSPFTVRTFVRRVYSKLKVTSKAEAIYEARTLGLVSD